LAILLENEHKTKFAVVTGAGKGIGCAIAKTLAQKGYTIIACARTLEDLQLLQAEIPGILVFTADLATTEGVGALIVFVAAQCGVPDVIVNNVGKYTMDTMLTTNAKVFDELMQVNYWAGYRLTMPFLKAMAERGSGHIFTICSVASIEPKENASSYSITKHAQLGFSRNLAADLKATGVKVTAILPANVDTPSWDGFEGDRSTFLKPEDIANVVLEQLERGESGEILIRDKAE